jgi:site-specific DNA-methyltransferase (adenine-specific)
VTDPYYEDDSVTLYLGDCLEVLADLPAASVDVVLTDPPFFMPAVHYSSRTHWQRSWGDTSILASFWRSVVDATTPTVKPSGHFLAFCDGNSYPVFYPEMYRKFDSVGSIVWDKGRIGMGSPWRNQHELIIAARWQGSFRSENRGCPDVVKVAPISSQKRLHPVDKPVALLAELLKPVLPEGGVVLDPFVGGGSTIIAAKQAGARAIGIETEERYLEIVATRLAELDAQQAFDFGSIDERTR